jgi:hypothetical protein
MMGNVRHDSANDGSEVGWDRSTPIIMMEGMLMNGKMAGREWSADVDGMGSFELWRLGNWSFELGDIQ